MRDLSSALDDVVRVANGLDKVAAGGNATAINDFVKQNGAADRAGESPREAARHEGLRGIGMNVRLAWIPLVARCWRAAAATPVDVHPAPAVA